MEGARLSSWFNDTGDVTHRYHIGWDRQNMYGHFDIWKITACLQSSVDNLAEILGGFCTFTDNLSCLLPFLRLTDTDSCQREIKMVGVKKAVKSPPSFAAFGNELEAPAVSGYSTVSPTNCTAHSVLHTANCTLYTAHCILDTAYCTLLLHTVCCTLHTAHCVLQYYVPQYCVLHTAHCILHTWVLF